MPKLYEVVSPARQMELAVQSRSPARLAQTFAAFVGQFYDRAAFDALARQASALYEMESPDRASAFRAHLDRRLCDRYHTPVAWEVAPASRDQAA